MSPQEKIVDIHTPNTPEEINDLSRGIASKVSNLAHMQSNEAAYELGS